MPVGDPPIRPPAPKPPDPNEFILSPVEGKPHLQRDQHGRLHTKPSCPFCKSYACIDYECFRGGFYP